MKFFLVMMVLLSSTFAITLKEKVQYLDNIKELVILTQTLRGKTNVYTKADDLNISDIRAHRKKVFTSLHKLYEKFHEDESPVDVQLLKIGQYMKALNSVIDELDSLVTFQANTLLIAEMLRIGFEAQESLFANEKKAYKDASFMMMHQILPMTENIGQLRGLGAGAVACRNCNDDEAREYIKDYLALTKDNLDEFAQQMQTLQLSYKNQYPNDLELDMYVKDVKHFLRHIEIVTIEKSTKPDDCDLFKQGTKMISKTLDYYEINKALIH